jgi:hypothetical protein
VNLAIERSVDRAHANYLIDSINQLSYRQLCMIAVLSKKGDYGITSMLPTNPQEFTVPAGLASAFQELYELYTQGLVQTERGGYVLTFSQIHPHSLEAKGNGAVLYILAELFEIPSSDLNGVAGIFRQR